MNPISTHLLPIVLLIFSILLFSHNPANSATEEAFLADADENTSLLTEEKMLLALLDSQTEIATKTKMNADFVPGMVTVLIGEELEQQGFHTVWQALGSVAGMENVTDALGGRQVRVRGIGGIQGDGHIKILLDNMNMLSTFLGIAQAVMDMPIEQVERIDIIRGAGSALYGEEAFTAVVNITSRKTEKNIYTGLGENNNRLIGGNYQWDFPENKASASLNLAYSETDGAKNYVASDGLFLSGASIGLSQAGISRAPGYTSEQRDYQSILFNFRLQDYDLKFNWLNTEHGAHFGALHVLPDEKENLMRDTKVFELSRAFNWSQNMTIKARLGWRQTTYDLDLSINPPGYQLWVFPTFPQTLDDGFLTQVYYQEQEHNLSIDFFLNHWDKHALLLGWEYSKTQVKNTWEKTNLHSNGTRNPFDDYPLPTVQKFDYDDGAQVADNGTTRERFSVTFQDEYRPFHALMLTAGVRFDSYSDIGDNVSPRLAAVYNISKHHIIKSQYAEAFRPPTFAELSSINHIQPQTNKTIDIGYLYKKFNRSFAITAYYSKIADTIRYHPLAQYYNADNMKLKGVEMEIEQRFSNRLSASFNLSYAKTKDENTGESNPFMANWLSNLSLNYQADSRNHFSIRYKYVGEKHREVNDPRDKLDDYHRVDINVAIKDFLAKGSTLQIGVDNLFNEDIRFASPMTTDILGSSFPGYEDDYPREGRSWWMRLKYQI